MVRLIDSATGKTARDLPGFDPNTSGLTFSSNGQVLATMQGTNVRRWDLMTGKQLPAVEQKVAIDCLALSPDGQTLALGMSSIGIIELCDGATGRVLRVVYGFRQDELNDSAGPDVLFSRDGRTLIASGGYSVRRWDVASGKEIRAVPQGHVSAVASLAVSRDGQQLATLSKSNIGGQVHFWNTATGQCQRTIDGPTIEGFFRIPDASLSGRVAFAPDGKSLAIGWPIGYLAVHDVATGRPLCSMSRAIQAVVVGAQPIVSLAFLPNGRLVSGDLHGRVELWDLKTGEQTHSFAPSSPAARMQLMDLERRSIGQSGPCRRLPRRPNPGGDHVDSGRPSRSTMGTGQPQAVPSDSL